MFEANGYFDTFRNRLAARGVTMRLLWEASAGVRRTQHAGVTKARRQSDVALYQFIGNGFQPSVGTAVLVDYGPRDGFGIWFEGNSNQIDDDVDYIVGMKAA